MVAIECPKCRGKMEEGFLKDEGEGKVLKWVEGTPEWSFWMGAKTRGKNQARVIAYRCTGCGYLESYSK